MNFLMTGQSGFIGSHLSRHLLQNGYNVAGLDRAFNKIKILEANKHYDAVFHCAASHTSLTDDYYELKDGNLRWTNDLLKYLDKLSIKKLVFFSTVSVYGQPRKEQLTINSPIIAPSTYGKLKRQTEELIINWGNQNRVITHCIRLPAVLGFGGHNTFLVRLIDAIRNSKPIETYSLLSKFNHAVSIEDVINYAFDLSIRCNTSSLSQIASANPVSLGEIVNQICGFLGHKSICVLPNNIISGIIDISIAKQLGFKPQKIVNIVDKLLVNDAQYII